VASAVHCTGWGAEGRARDVGGRPLQRDGDAQPARPWRRCAGRYFLVRRFGGVTRFAFPTPPPVVRRRDRPLADGDARGAEGAASMDARPGA